MLVEEKLNVVEVIDLAAMRAAKDNHAEAYRLAHRAIEILLHERRTDRTKQVGWYKSDVPARSCTLRAMGRNEEENAAMAAAGWLPAFVEDPA